MQLVRTILAICLLGCTQGCAPPEPDQAPHIIVLIADDLGLDQAPCHSPDIRMPFLESRCANAFVSDRTYTHPYCTASRASLMTGRHPFRHGADDVRAQAKKLPLAEVTIAELIKQGSQSSYETSGFGKWHLADEENGSERNPNLQGFDHYAGNPRQHHTYKYFDYDWFENGRLIGRVAEYKTTHITDSVISYFQERGQSGPQFSIVSYTNPHKPFHAPPENLHSFGALPALDLTGTRSSSPGPEEYRANRREARFDPYYFAMLEALDSEIERLVAAIESQSDRPVVFVFLGDNGSAAEVFAPVEGSRVRSKATLYDGGVRVPLMIWSADAGQLAMRAGRSDQILHIADLFPTLAGLAGVSPEKIEEMPAELDGVAFETALREGLAEDRSPREFAFFERGNDEQLPFAYGGVDRQGLKLILRESARATNYSPGILVEIYDTNVDPLETRNLLDTPCAIPVDRVNAVFDFVASKAAQNEGHSDWFSPDAYKTVIRDAIAACGASPK